MNFRNIKDFPKGCYFAQINLIVVCFYPALLKVVPKHAFIFLKNVKSAFRNSLIFGGESINDLSLLKNAFRVPKLL